MMIGQIDALSNKKSTIDYQFTILNRKTNLNHQKIVKQNKTNK